jgi:hypothetical protein
MAIGRVSMNTLEVCRDTVELTRDEILAQIDQVSRKRLGLTAEEALQQWRAGELEDPGAVGDALVLSDLLDPEDPVFGA